MRYNRIGRFYLTNDVENDPFAYQAFFADVVVLRAQRDFVRNRTEYILACEQFEPIPPGSEIPEYVATIDHGTLNVTWHTLELFVGVDHGHGN